VAASRGLEKPYLTPWRRWWREKYVPQTELRPSPHVTY